MNVEKQKTASTELTLDMAGQYPLRVSLDAEGKPQLDLDLTKSSRQWFRQHLQDFLQLEVDGKIVKPQPKPPEAISPVAVHSPTSQKDIKENYIIHFPLPDNIQEGAAITLRFHYAPSDAVKNSQPVSALIYHAGQTPTLTAGSHHAEYQLAISETRALGRKLRRDDQNPARDVLHKIPYNRKDRKDFDANTHAPITDVHTHASAQVSGVSLMAAAIEEDQKNPITTVTINGEKKSFTGICYPVQLLESLGVPPDSNQVPVDMLSREFNPTKNDGWDCEKKDTICYGIRAKDLTEPQRGAIIAKMDIAADATMSFSDFDREMYRYRNPFVKHPALTKPILRSIAADYKAHGVKYAELSTGSMMDPAWFKEMVEAVEEIERDDGPKLRFLIGIPRNASPVQTLITLEKIKHLARHPYIVGADLLGYESNKTSEFGWALAHLADWARAREGGSDLTHESWDFKRDFIIRVHAGETAKNQDNVRQAIKIAADYNVRVRIGHGLHASLDAESKRNLQAITAHMDEKEIDKNPDQFAFERCMDSNQVYRTNMLVHDQPAFLKLQGEAQRFAPRFLCSDGGGALGTHPVQLAYSALAAGMTLDDLAHIRQFEEGYVDRQAQREALKTKAFTTHYGAGEKGLAAFLDEYKAKVNAIPREPRAEPPKEENPLLDYLPPVFTNKTPILIGGASGSSWEKMDPNDQKHVQRAMELLVRVCDPKKTYFVLGRVQREGVSKALDVAVKHWNADHPQEKFAVLGRFAGAGKDPTSELADTVDWVQDIPEGRDYVPASMLRFMTKHGGRAIFFNGSDFTAEMAYGADDKAIPHALHEPLHRPGKMSEVAQTTETKSQFRDLDGFVEHVLKASGLHHFFRTELDKSILREGVDLDAVKKAVEEPKMHLHAEKAKPRSGSRLPER